MGVRDGIVPVDIASQARVNRNLDRRNLVMISPSQVVGEISDDIYIPYTPASAEDTVNVSARGLHVVPGMSPFVGRRIYTPRHATLDQTLIRWDRHDSGLFFEVSKPQIQKLGHVRRRAGYF